MLGSGIVNCSLALQGAGGGREGDGAELWLLLHVVDGESARVDISLEGDVVGSGGRLEEIAVLIDGVGEVISSGAYASVGKNMVNTAVLLVGRLEQVDQVLPAANVGPEKGEVPLEVILEKRLNITANYRGPEVEEEFASSETNA
jgi:hypothetical protein